jgi:CyaY protein
LHGFYFFNGLTLYNRILSDKSKQVTQMNDLEYDKLTDNTLLAVEEAIEQLELDLDYESHGGLLSITFPDQSKIIINKQPPLQQLWLATKFNGHHFEWRNQQWIDNRTGSEFWQLLSDAASKQAGSPVVLTQPQPGTE